MTAADLRDGLTVRSYEPADEPVVLALIEDSLGWRPDDPNAELFAWKHRDNAFGRSPAWVACDHGEVVGFRTFMRWGFRQGAQRYAAVRAVDTATHRAYRGRGIFAGLTARAVVEMTALGIDFVFNTPNDQSRPGYLKLGWQPVGRLPVAFRPRSPATLPRVARARVAADLWSVPTSAGHPAGELLADEQATGALLAALPRSDRLVTDRTPGFLRWRYGLAPLHYRALPVGRTAADGVLVFRLRRRGAARELVVSDLLLPPARRRRAGRLLRDALGESGADYAVALRQAVPARSLLPLPRQGPVLTTRTLAGEASTDVDRWGLSLGDVELF
jgi:GNAT superfamily N-acetyltransferase